MTDNVVTFPKNNKRFPLHQFKQSFIYAQANNENVSELSIDAAAIVSVLFSELLENLGFDTTKPEIFCDLIMARESIKSYILAYGNNGHIFQKLTTNIISIKDNVVYLNQKNVYDMIRAVER